MRSLTEVFAPGAPTLPEGLRTLAVSPDRELEPGMTVRATFTFRNQGGAPATGVRVRFNLPEGLVYLVGSGELDGVAADDEQGNSPLLARGGAHIGDVLPGEERRIEIAYSVAGAIENGSTVELQAAVASFELAPVGSNVVRLIARSRPQLENVLSTIAVEARHDAVPGGEVGILVRIHNAGESSAHDVVVVAPIPAHTSYIPNSARVNGREIERELATSFDRVHAPVIVSNLPASATATLAYRVRIDDPLPDGTAIVAGARVASQETAPFSLLPASLAVGAAPDFSDDRTTFVVEPAYDVQPGSRVSLSLHAVNVGTASAESVTATIESSDSLLLVRGGSRIDGRPVRDRKKDAATFDLGRIDKGEAVELTCEVMVASPLANGESLPLTLRLSWEPQRKGSDASRRFERAVLVRSEPFLSPRRNAIVRHGAEIVRPGDEVEAVISLANDGSAPATDASLRLRVDPGLEEVRLFERNARVGIDDDAASLGTIEAYGQRKLTVRARVRSPYADRSELRLGAALVARESGETSLRETTWRVDSHPAFSATSSRLELSSDGVLRPNQLAEAVVRLRNDGSDTAHNVRIRLYVSPEARLESVDGATRERSTIVFGEIAPGASAQARLGLRLLRGLARAYPVTVDAVLGADAMLPLPLERLTIATTAQADFSVGTFRSEPTDGVDVGEMVEWFLHVRNGGDGPARRAQIAIVQPNTLIYVPNSTTVNDVPVRDVGALPPFAAERGIALNDVDPGVEATIRWRDVVHNGLPAGEAIVRIATVAYDGDRVDEIVATELHVRATPAFANTIPGLPFGVDGMLGPAFAGGQRALTEERFVELPPATPVGRAADEAPQYLALDVGQSPATLHPSATFVGTIVAFGDERLARTRRFLNEARFDGLVTHLFAIRALFPDAIGDEHATTLSAQRDLLRETLDRLFIKLRLPNYVVAPRDLETPSFRATLQRFVHGVADTRGTPAQPPGTTLVLRGECDIEAMREIGERLAQAPLAGALAWNAFARMMPNETPALAGYREALVDVLDELSDAETIEFLDALQRRSFPDLDAALQAVRETLAR
jgi:uncharacterized repeat protein (TIGR01451 family)